MNDIVERLERGVFDAETSTYVSYSLCDEAADTITTLRAELASQVQWVKDLADSLIAEEAKTATLRADNERLRAAMEKIEYLDRPQVRGLPRRVSIQEIATAALAQEKPMTADRRAALDALLATDAELVMDIDTTKVSRALKGDSNGR